MYITKTIAITAGATRSELPNGMHLSDYANLGAADTEVRYFVVDLLGKTFGEQGTLTNTAPTIGPPWNRWLRESEELNSELSRAREFLNEQFDAARVSTAAGSWCLSTGSRLTALTAKATASRCLNRPAGSAATACMQPA